MFDVWCPMCDARVLLTPRRIERLRNTPGGIVVSWRCWCGTRGEVETGRPTNSPLEAADTEPTRQPGAPVPA